MYKIRITEWALPIAEFLIEVGKISELWMYTTEKEAEMQSFANNAKDRMSPGIDSKKRTKRTARPPLIIKLHTVQRRPLIDSRNVVKMYHWVGSAQTIGIRQSTRYPELFNRLLINAYKTER